jgi:hypothetical protein
MSTLELVRSRIWQLVTFANLVGLCAGCVSVRAPTQRLSEEKTESKKNYKLNERFSVSVGEAVILRKSYIYKEFEAQDRVIAASDFRATSKIPFREPLIYAGRKDEQLLVLGTTTLGKNACRIVSLGQLTDGSPFGMLVDFTTGLPVGKGVWRNPVLGSWQSNNLNIKVEPGDVVFKVINRVEVNTSKPYENYEIVYTGRLGENVTFVYREYTPDSLAKPAFYQNLTYNLGEAKQIRFRKIQMEVFEASNEQISLKVLSD